MEADDQQLQLARNADRDIDMAADYSTCQEVCETFVCGVISGWSVWQDYTNLRHWSGAVPLLCTSSGGRVSCSQASTLRDEAG